MLKKVKNKKIKGYKPGGVVSPTLQTISSSSLFASQIKPKDPSRYVSKNLLKKTGLIKV